MGRAQLPTTMNALTFFGLFFCFLLLVGPTLSLQCYVCAGGAGGLKCDDANPGAKTDCSSFSTDFCILGKAGDIETRSCGAGSLANTAFKEGCTEETALGVTATNCYCKGKLCNETVKTAAAGSASVYISSLAVIFYVAFLCL